MDIDFERSFTLKDISDTSQRISAFIRSNPSISFSPPPIASHGFTIPRLNLDIPEDILSPLRSLGLPDRVYQEIYLKVVELLQKIRETHLDSYNQCAQKLLKVAGLPDLQPMPELLNKLRAFYETSFLQREMPRVQSYISSLPSTLHTVGNTRRRVPFNHEYTPILEEYFKYNAYPLPADRQMLARKCMMTPRQIEVWFQNHRNRAGKDGNGKRLRRLQIHPLPANISLESLEKKMPAFTMKKTEILQHGSQIEPLDDDGVSETEHALSSTASISTIYDKPAPPHAFPATWKDKCDYEPFPKDASGAYKFNFPPPTWTRQPASAIPKKAQKVDMDEFVELFATQLHLRGKRNRQKVISRDDVPWFASKVTVPCSAPHPALVRLPLLPQASGVVRAPISTAFSPSTGRSRSSTPASDAISHNATTRRPVARLPRRIPKNTPKSVGKDSFAFTAYPSPSSSIPSPQSSRTSSLSSVSSTSPSGRSTSSSSFSPSPPATPQLSPSLVPQNIEFPHDDIQNLYPLDDTYWIKLASSVGSYQSTIPFNIEKRIPMDPSIFSTS